METSAPAALDRRYQTHVAVLLAAAAVATTLIAARTADLAGAAGGNWERSVRVQVKRGALQTENELFVYGDPVTVVTQYKAARIRAEAYEQALARGGLTQSERTSLAVFADAEHQLATAFRGVLGGESGWLEGPQETYDLAGRLASEQVRTRGAQELRAAGDESSRRAIVEALAAVPAAFAFLLASAAQAWPRQAKTLLLAGATMLSMSLGARTESPGAPSRTPSGLIGSSRSTS